MKRSGLTPRLVAATLFLVALVPATFAAEEMSPSTPSARATKRTEELLKRYDKNGDGKIDDDERAAAKEEMMKEQIDRQVARATALPGGLERFRAQVLEMFDKNRDGRLDDEERAAAQKFAEEYRAADGAGADLIKRFDKNGDGKLDDEERAQSEMYLVELRALSGGQLRNQLVRRFDRNADGRIDEAEMTELERVVRPRLESNPVQRQRYDKNGDGKIDDMEWAAARLAISHWVNGGGPAALENDPALRSDSGPTFEQERARLKAVEEEVARRRALREAAAAGKNGK